MIDITSDRRYISTKDYKKYLRVVSTTLEALVEPHGGKTEAEKDYYDFCPNATKEEIQEAIDFFVDLKEYLPTDAQFYGGD